MASSSTQPPVGGSNNNNLLSSNPGTPRRVSPMDLPQHTIPLEVQHVDPAILEYARGRGIAADTTKAPPYFDVHLDIYGDAERRDKTEAWSFERFNNFKEQLGCQSLDVSFDTRGLLTEALKDSMHDMQPDWKSIFPSIHGCNVPRDQPYLLTEQGELAAKTILTRRMLGTDISSLLPPEDSPLEIDCPRVPQKLRDMANTCLKLKEGPSDKLDVSKESLGLISDSRQGKDLSDKHVESIYKGILPQMKAHSIQSRDSLLPLHPPEAGVKPPKRKHKPSIDLSPVKENLQPVQRAIANRSVSAAVGPTNTSLSASSTLATAATSPKRLKTAQSMPYFPKAEDANHPYQASPSVKNPISSDKDITPSTSSFMVSDSSSDPTISQGTSSPPDQGSGGPVARPTAFVVTGPDGVSVESKSGVGYHDTKASQRGCHDVDPSTNLSSLRQASSLAQPEPDLKSLVSQGAALELGSLSRFMETRGVSEKETQFTSPHFTRENPDTGDIGPNSSSTSPLETYASRPGNLTIKSQSNTPAPEDITANLILFLSTNLLKTHLDLVKSLEKHPSGPKLVFRDYSFVINLSQESKSVPSESSADSDGPLFLMTEEADIIISPNAAVMLTTTQALTQRYLPGHPPADPSFPPHTRFNGPVLTRLMRLSLRYECLYVVVLHAEPPHGGMTSNVDQPTRESIVSLAISCDLTASYGTTVPVIVSANPDRVASVILSLSDRHMFQLPSIQVPGMQIPGTGAENSTASQINQIITTAETQWEIFLRSLGLNPFASRLILAILQSREEAGAAGCDIHNSETPLYEKKSSALCTFLTMKHDQMVAEFGGLVGLEVLFRVHHVLQVVPPALD